jgi:hypothetical protein
MTTAAEITLGVNRDRRQLLQPPKYATAPGDADETPNVFGAVFCAGSPLEAKPPPGKRAASFSGVAISPKIMSWLPGESELLYSVGDISCYKIRTKNTY